MANLTELGLGVRTRWWASSLASRTCSQWSAYARTTRTCAEGATGDHRSLLPCEQEKFPYSPAAPAYCSFPCLQLKVSNVSPKDRRAFFVSPLRFFCGNAQRNVILGSSLKTGEKRRALGHIERSIACGPADDKNAPLQKWCSSHAKRDGGIEAGFPGL